MPQLRCLWSMDSASLPPKDVSSALEYVWEGLQACACRLIRASGGRSYGASGPEAGSRGASRIIPDYGRVNCTSPRGEIGHPT
ncbi:hypothetical protein VNO78_03037 [Psophocarpus tetragonolobus]|uniref:Uncharacterized protein n=1 Tax=Psophocarpus tetragonolobus TaxID=3891 RepID=A0AAN9XW92_PSOTE